MFIQQPSNDELVSYGPLCTVRWFGYFGLNLGGLGGDRGLNALTWGHCVG